VQAFDGLSTLVTVPEQAVLFVRERLKPAPAPDEKEIATRIAELDSDTFRLRQQAAEALRKIGPTAGPALRKALDARPTVEVARRIEILLDELDRVTLGGDGLRALRAVEILEMIGTREARTILTALSRGAPGAPTTEAAKVALERLAKHR
jgi:hypothetical protein